MMVASVDSGYDDVHEPYYIRGEPYFSYPAPIIYSDSLRYNGTTHTPSEANYTSVTVPASGASYWLTFSGQFGSFPDFNSVEYKGVINGTEYRFPCYFQPYIPDDPLGGVSESEVVCRTATQEPAGVYQFEVTVANQVSGTGLDELFLPSVPEIVDVTGCVHKVDDGTGGCHTEGGERITITGLEDFGDSTV